MNVKYFYNFQEHGIEDVVETEVAGAATGINMVLVPPPPHIIPPGWNKLDPVFEKS